MKTLTSLVGGPWLSISLPYRYYISSEVSEVCINLKTNLLMPWHPEIFLRVKECPAYSERTKNLLFMHSTFGTKEYIHYSVSVKGYIQYQRVYSAPIKGYIQYQRVYSVSKGIFSINGYIQYQRVYSVSKGIFSIKEYVQPKGIFSKKEYIHSVPMGTVHRCTIGLGNCWVKTIFFSKTLYL